MKSKLVILVLMIVPACALALAGWQENNSASSRVMELGLSQLSRIRGKNTCTTFMYILDYACQTGVDITPCDYDACDTCISDCDISNMSPYYNGGFNPQQTTGYIQWNLLCGSDLGARYYYNYCASHWFPPRPCDCTGANIRSGPCDLRNWNQLQICDADGADALDALHG